MGKHSNVSFSTEQRLGENIVLRSMECLTSSAGPHWSQQHSSNRCAQQCKCTIIGNKQLQKRNVAFLNGAHQAKKQCDFGSCQLEQQQGGLHIASSKSCKPKRCSWCWNKVERKCIQEKHPNQFHCCNQNMGFVNRMDQRVGNYRIGIRMKK